MPDTSRAARYVLKDYVSAKLVFCHPPPGIDADTYMEDSRAKMIEKQEEDIRLGKKKAPVTRVAKGADTFVGPSEPDLENTFFSEAGPLPRPVAKGAPGLGQEGGYSRTMIYPHAHRIGPDGLPIDQSLINPVVLPTRKGKKHFKIKEGKKRSGKGYD
jgi:large subunit GTPase 1